MEKRCFLIIRSICPMLLICATLLSGCAEQIMEGREPLSADGITQFTEEFRALTDANREAHNAGDLDAIQALFTEDMLFEDRTFKDHLVGIKSFMSMTRRMFAFFPGFQWKTIGYFTDSDKLLTITEFWGLSFSGNPDDQYTEEDPFIHVFLFTREKDLISSWRLFWSPEFLKDNHRISEFEAEQMRSLVSTYAEAWSSMDPNVLAEMYADDAVRQDTLFGENQDGQTAISTFAESFFAQYPDAEWTTLEIFGEKPYKDKPQAVGSSYTFGVTNPSNQACEVKVVVLLHVLDGKIIQEDRYYEPESLIRCGWAQ